MLSIPMNKQQVNIKSSQPNLEIFTMLPYILGASLIHLHFIPATYPLFLLPNKSQK